RSRQAERRAGDQRAEPDRGGLAGEAGQRDPGVARPGLAVAAHGEVVVGAEERIEPQQLALLGDREEVVVGGALLGLGEDAQSHQAGEPFSGLASLSGFGLDARSSEPASLMS